MGREVRCPDRMSGTRLGPENPNEESHETDRAGAGAQHDATPGNQGGGGVALSFVRTRLKPA